MTKQILGNIDELLAAGAVIEPKLEQLKFSLKEKIETLKQVDAKKVEVTGDEELENETEQADEFKDSLDARMVRLASASSASTVSMPSIAPAVSTPAPGNRVKLSKLTTQPFDGETTKWTPFWDCCDSAIHKKPGLSQ